MLHQFVLHQIATKKGSVRGLFLCLFFVANGALASPVATEPGCDIELHSSSLKGGEVPAGVEHVVVVDVYDGDTVLLEDGRKIRVIGVNTPELGRHNRTLDKAAEPLANDARERLLQLLVGSGRLTNQKGITRIDALVKVGRDPLDHYGRTLGHLFSKGGANVTRLLLKEGLGFHVAIPPNLWGVDCYVSAQEKARVSRAGVWGERYYDGWPAHQKGLRGGYQRVIGKIEKLFVGKRYIWADLKGHVTLKLDQHDSLSLQGAVLKRILDAHEGGAISQLPDVEVQGWFIDRSRWGVKMAKKIKLGERNRWLLNIRHHTQWKFASS